MTINGKTHSGFASILSQLRKERGNSQKKTAADLGISQALLSHYEKGIRECGLDFVIKCSEYYGVTTDYLLGVSNSRYGLDEEFLNGVAESGEDNSLTMISQATKLLLEIATAANEDKETAQYINDYYMLCIYRGALTLAKSGKLPQEMFRLDYSVGHELASAAISMLDARFVFMDDNSRTGEDLSSKTDLHKLIEEAENYLLNTFASE